MRMIASYTPAGSGAAETVVFDTFCNAQGGDDNSGHFARVRYLDSPAWMVVPSATVGHIRPER